MSTRSPARRASASHAVRWLPRRSANRPPAGRPRPTGCRLVRRRPRRVGARRRRGRARACRAGAGARRRDRPRRRSAGGQFQEGAGAFYAQERRVAGDHGSTGGLVRRVKPLGQEFDGEGCKFHGAILSDFGEASREQTGSFEQMGQARGDWPCQDSRQYSWRVPHPRPDGHPRPPGAGERNCRSQVSAGRLVTGQYLSPGRRRKQ